MTTRYSFKNPEMIIAGSALLVSLITAFVSIYSAFVDRAYARASVWPRLEISRSYNDSYFSYEVGNKGTGPAVIKYARLTYENESIQNWPQYLQLRNGRSVEHVQSHIGSIVLSAGESRKPLRLNDAEAAKVLVGPDNLQIELCYCSIYDECWLVDRANEPELVGQCQIDEKQRFLQ